MTINICTKGMTLFSFFSSRCLFVLNDYCALDVNLTIGHHFQHSCEVCSYWYYVMNLTGTTHPICLSQVSVHARHGVTHTMVESTENKGVTRSIVESTEIREFIIFTKVIEYACRDNALMTLYVICAIRL